MHSVNPAPLTPDFRGLRFSVSCIPFSSRSSPCAGPRLPFKAVAMARCASAHRQPGMSIKGREIRSASNSRWLVRPPILSSPGPLMSRWSDCQAKAFDCVDPQRARRQDSPIKILVMTRAHQGVRWQLSRVPWLFGSFRGVTPLPWKCHITPPSSSTARPLVACSIPAYAHRPGSMITLPLLLFGLVFVAQLISWVGKSVLQELVRLRNPAHPGLIAAFQCDERSGHG